MSPKELSGLIAEKHQQLNTIEGTECKVYSRCVGYHSPTSDWNKGKQEEFGTRNLFSVAR